MWKRFQPGEGPGPSLWLWKPIVKPMEHYTALVKIAKYWLTDGLVAVLTWSGEHSVQAGEAVGAALHLAEGGEGGVAAAALRPASLPAL